MKLLIYVEGPVPNRGETLRVSSAIAQEVEIGRKTGLSLVSPPNSRYPRRLVLPIARISTAVKNNDLGEPSLSFVMIIRRVGIQLTRIIMVVMLFPVGVQRFDLKKPAGKYGVMSPDPQTRVRMASVEMEISKL